MCVKEIWKRRRFIRKYRIFRKIIRVFLKNGKGE